MSHCISLSEFDLCFSFETNLDVADLVDAVRRSVCKSVVWYAVDAPREERAMLFDLSNPADVAQLKKLSDSNK